VPFTDSKVDILLLDVFWLWTVHLPPQLYNRSRYLVSPAQNVVKVDRKEGRGTVFYCKMFLFFMKQGQYCKQLMFPFLIKDCLWDQNQN